MKKLGALKHISRHIPRYCRLTLANGLIISKVLYLLPIWWGTYSNQLNKMQSLMNKTSRWVNNLSRKTKTKVLMEKNNWLNIRELVNYHTSLMFWKTIWLGSPNEISKRITRQPDNTITTIKPRLQTVQMGFLWRATQIWNKYPQDIREIKSFPRFKKKY